MADYDERWPFAAINPSPEALVILQSFWHQIQQRRPFKWDFTKMRDDAPAEFNAMFSDIAKTIDDGARKRLEERADYLSQIARICTALSIGVESSNIEDELDRVLAEVVKRREADRG